MHKKKLNIGFIGGGLNSAIGLVHKSAILMDGLFSLNGGMFSRNTNINKKTAAEFCFDEKMAYDSKKFFW